MIIRQLDITKNYTIISARHLVDDADTCENCGRIITNIVTLRDDDGKIYNVGTECAKTIHKFMNTWDGARELKQAEKTLKDFSKFHNWVIKKAVYRITIGDKMFELLDVNKKSYYKVNLNLLDDKITSKIMLLQKIEGR